jgi:hypothetical protein
MAPILVRFKPRIGAGFYWESMFFTDF